MTVATETRPAIKITFVHHTVRLLYRFVFITLLFGTLTNVAQGFFVNGYIQLPSGDDIRKVWYVRGMLEQPWLYVPLTVALLALGIGGYLIDRWLNTAEVQVQDQRTAGIATTAAQDHVKTALPALKEAVATQVETRLDAHEQQVQATITSLLDTLPKAPTPTIYGPPFDDALLMRPLPFVGRADELGWLMARVQQGNTSAITAVGGIGGIGKTGLVAEMLARAKEQHLFPDGIAVVLCQGRTDTLSILRDALTRFDPERKPPQAHDLASLADSARMLLHGKRVASVFDNLELGSTSAN